MPSRKPRTPARRRWWRQSIVPALVLCGAATASEPPNPLTLETALSFAAASGHPRIRNAELGVDISRYAARRAAQMFDPNVRVQLVPRVAKRSDGTEEDFFDDSLARLALTATVYDFGRSRARGRAARALEQEQNILLGDDRVQHQIDVLERFLHVLLADTRYAIVNERMTLAFLRFDRLREKRDLFDEVSALDVAEAETAYRELFAHRTEAELGQQQARLRLGIVLGSPGYLPRDLVRPDLQYWTGREIPEYKALLDKALPLNPSLLAAKHKVSAAEARLAAARAAYRPRVYSEILLSEFATTRASRDDVRASLNIEIPIFQRHRRIDVEVAGLELERTKTEMRLIQSALRETLFELTTRLLVLKRQGEADVVRQRYRDAYMDRSRALYEMEVRTDLGDAQANLLEADWLGAKTEFETAIAWARIDALMGRPIANSEHTQ